ncbi:MAG: fumarylacetoacetate hydrolase family protein [Acidimicrobiia bacterium]
MLTPVRSLPGDVEVATLVGRVWITEHDGPSVVAVRDGEVYDISSDVPTMTDLINADSPIGATTGGTSIGPVEQLLAESSHVARSTASAWLLAPVDLQPVKASGVTFAASLLERVIEEQAGGDPNRADAIRQEVTAIIGSELAEIAPGSDRAMELKERLIEQGSWSQYLEVGLGPDAEVFTKAAPMSSVGTGSEIGILAESEWNNPEPELAVFANDRGEIVGISLANDVNLRDIEGRSALLLGMAKDNNAACSIGPFLRLFDDNFDLDDARRAVVGLRVTGDDGFEMEGKSSIELISRDLADLVAATIGDHHQYPDGVVLLSGTMFAPTEDRGESGQGFTHHRGDIVEIHSPQLGSLVNRVNHAHLAEPWTFGIRDLMANLAKRGLLR